jgi:prepilin-type N-terminal cleavage/methylation domain-containing protein
MISIFKREKGISLIETICALAILGIIAVAFLSALATTSRARATNDERTSAKILAETLLETIKTDNFTLTYDPEIPPEFAGYTATVTSPPERNGDIQKITITIHHGTRDVLILESYKVDRES